MKRLIKGLREFKARYVSTHQELLEQLSQGQKPRVLFITCSDSRVDPNLITQAGLGELFVIRNAGNIIPPFGATNGGEGATIEYAVQALKIKQIIVCGHSHCGAMKGLMKLNSISEEMPLMHDWLKYAEATRKLAKDHYSQYQGEELLEIVIAENVLTQIENLRTYPVIRSLLYEGQLKIYAWIYQIETGEVLAFDQESHAYVLPQNQLLGSDDDTIVTQKLLNGNGTVDDTSSREEVIEQEFTLDMHQRFPMTRLSKEQAERIYRGSTTN